MKISQKSILLFAISSLLLTACQTEKRCFCLETYNSVNYQEGYCYQLSRKDVLETIFVFCLPTKSADGSNEDFYEVTWKKNYNVESFKFVEGLEGKKIKSVVLLENNTLRINVSNACIDQEATSGYLRIGPDAFDYHSDSSKNSFLYAYFAIGENSAVVVKPEDITF